LALRGLVGAAKTRTIIDEAYERAIEVLRQNATSRGLKASHSYYNQIWARDSFISFVGANLLNDESMLRCARATVDTFAKMRSELGQIANHFDLATGMPEFGFSGSTDSSAWYIIGVEDLFRTTGDRSLLKDPLDAALDAYRWLRYQDANNTWLIDSPQGADWMDAAIQRTGKTLYNNTLFLMATKSLAALAAAAGRSTETSLPEWTALKQRFSDVFLPGKDGPARVARYWPRLGELLASQKPMGLAGEYYLHYVSFARVDVHFDTLSNILCVLSGLSELKTSLSILASVRARRLTDPFPIRVLDPPYRRGEQGFDDSFNESLPAQHRSRAFEYHNGAVWPFVGGLYVCVLNRLQIDGAMQGLEALAESNSVLKPGEKTGFNEWLHGRTGQPMGQYGQSWNAGMFVAAVQSSRGKFPLE
jgi:glycogen debranching enzyme